MKKILAFLLCLCLFTGCGAADRDNIINLFSAPRLSRKEGEIVSAVRDYIGRDIILKYPRRGENKRPVITMDDGRGENRLALYIAPSVSGNIRIAFLEKSDGEWHVVRDKEGYGSEIYKIEFADLLDDGGRQVLVAYTFRDRSEKLLSAYFIRDGRLDGEQTWPCQDFTVRNVTGGDGRELLVAGLNSDNQRTRVTLFNGSRRDGRLYGAGSFELEVPNAYITNISVCKTDLSYLPAVLTDYRDPYGMVYTVGVCFEEEGCRTVLPPDTVQKVWRYSYDIISRDVDGDGYTETPTVIDSELSADRDLKFMEWTCFLLRQPVRKYFGVCDAKTRLFVPMPEEWQNYVSVSYDGDTGEVRIKSIATDDTLVTFGIQSPGDDTTREEDRVTVGLGAGQVKFVFDGQVPRRQRRYITGHIFYVK